MSKSVLVEIVKLNNALLLRLNSDFLTFFFSNKIRHPFLRGVVLALSAEVRSV